MEYVNLMGHNWYAGFLEYHPGLNEALHTGMIEGIPFKLLDKDIEVGDIYIAERNAGLKILTCRIVDTELGCYHPEEIAYSYDFGECFPIELLID